MAEKELNEAERELVRKYLERAHRELFHEIHKTDDRDFKAALKRERDDVAAILGKLGFFVEPA
jgi:hypothetical protein